MPEQDKTYHAKFQLGCSSDTEDIEGNIIYHDSEQAPSLDNLKNLSHHLLVATNKSSIIFSKKSKWSSNVQACKKRN